MTAVETERALEIPPGVASALLEGRYGAPHDVLGAHPARVGARSGVVVRAMHPDAAAAELVWADGLVAMQPLAQRGLFGVFLPDATPPLQYRVRFEFGAGRSWERGDPYCHWPTLGDVDLHLLNEGRHLKLWEVLGAHARRHEGVDGVAFAVWAPNAERVSVVGDFCRWDGRLYPMRSMGLSGIFEIFVPDLAPGALYQYEIRTKQGEILLKADPFAAWAELPPGRASRVAPAVTHDFRDESWMLDRPYRDVRREPMAVYEVHLGSWRRHDGLPPNYRSIAPELVRHMKHFGFTHLELLPICEHPFEGSWGYQVTSFFAPTSRYGTPDDFRYLIDLCHQHGIGVILDWVPAHFPRDTFALARFDGTPLYEHEDPRRGEHQDWGTLIFNLGRHEVRNFLIASALHWLESFHIDGLRVDAVASMLYRDYSRKAGEWVPNAHGGREDEEAAAFLRQLNDAINARQPGCFSIAEESTAWPGVTAPTSQGGLGFALKWNMGWMHDSLRYFAHDPIHRKHHQNDLTFAMLYEHSERYMMPLSHDEVVHGKGSLLSRMPGDDWQRFANLRALFAYQYTRPGKKLLFMGSELGSEAEWYHAAQLPWPSPHDALRQGLMRFCAELGALYLAEAALWQDDYAPGGFEWIDVEDHDQSVLSYVRRSGDELLITVLNLTPVPRAGYRIGAPLPGQYALVLDSDAAHFGGSGHEIPAGYTSDPQPWHRQQHSLLLQLPPLSVVVLRRTPDPEQRERIRAGRAGVLPGYHSVDGAYHPTSDATRRALLPALRESTEAPEASRERRQPEIDPVHVAREGSALVAELAVQIPEAGAARLEYTLEDLSHPERPPQHGSYDAPVGELSLPLEVDIHAVQERTLRCELGVLTRSGVHEHHSRVQQRLTVPRTAFGVHEALGGGAGAPAARGLWLQLYALRSPRNFGLGDLGDLAVLVRWAAAQGLDFLGLNPLHAPALPSHPVSPYFPISRLFRNVLYIDVNAVPELADCKPARALLESAELGRTLQQLRAAERIDYHLVWQSKWPVLEALGKHFQGPGVSPARRAAYAEYVAEQGEPLQAFACYTVLAAELGSHDFHDWPAAYHDVGSPEVAAFAREHARAIELQKYLQFELDRQLCEVQALARREGMRLGLYQDLAVGGTHGGADAWLYPGLFPLGVELGAPPDPLAPQGQRWGLSVLSPLRSRAQSHAYFRRLLRANMRHAGALRIDHAMAVQRQFWMPVDRTIDGAYVAYPVDELFGLIALESRRARCVVIGEDLGTVPAGFRERSRAWNVLGCQLARFEMDRYEGPRPAEQYSDSALVSLNTHDLPPFASFWSGADLELRHEIGLLDTDALAREQAGRAALRERWVAQLRAGGDLPANADAGDATTVLTATHAMLARSPAPLLALSLADLLGETVSANVPGTTAADGFESWTARLSISVDALPTLKR
jgi:1,4-alpha-glucan branching enzyme